MSYQRKMTIAVTLIVATGLCVAGSDRPGEPDEQTANQRLLELEECIATLEQRLGATESRLNSLTRLLVQVRAETLRIPEGDTAPPRATPLQFNGMTYYNMPLSATPTDK